MANMETGRMTDTKPLWPRDALCPDCGQRVLAAVSERGNELLIDPDPIREPDPEGRCLVFLRRGVVSSAIYADVTGRFDTYRGHPWSCPTRP